MNQRHQCEWEHEVFAQAIHEDWLRNAAPELHAHLDCCKICTDAATVAVAVALDRDRLRQAVALPKAERVWWMAQLKARREAAETAQRPIAAVEAAAWICIAVLACLVLAGAAWDVLAAHAFVAAGAAALVIAIPFAVHLAAGSD